MRSRRLCESVRVLAFALVALVVFPMAGLSADMTLRLGHVAPPGSLYDVAATKFCRTGCGKY